jgi:hypothetical protein
MMSSFTFCCQYFCNMYSEHVKAKYGEVDLTTRMVLEVGE